MTINKKPQGGYPHWGFPSMDISGEQMRVEKDVLERPTRFELVSIAWKATAQPIYQERLNKMKWSLNITPQIETALRLG